MSSSGSFEATARRNLKAPDDYLPVVRTFVEVVT